MDMCVCMNGILFFYFWNFYFLLGYVLRPLLFIQYNRAFLFLLLLLLCT